MKYCFKFTKQGHNYFEHPLRKNGYGLVKELTIKYKRYDDRITLLLHFPNFFKTETKFLLHCRVYWSYYCKKSTQCNVKTAKNTATEQTIATPLKCVKYAEPHQSKDCPLNDSPARVEGIIPARLLKCANCKGNHPATFSKCPARPTQAPILRTRQNPKPPPPSVDFNSFPLLPNVSNNTYQNINTTAAKQP